MARIPTFRTARLVLRPFTLDDVPRVVELAGARAIADTTLAVPHPYTHSAAESWIGSHRAAFEAGAGVCFAIVEREGTLVGSVALASIDPEHLQAELGYWIGVPYWGRGYATEAARRVVRFGFERLGMNRIHAHHMERNPASGRVLAKLGMQREGLLRQRVRKWGHFEDVVQWAVLRSDPRPGAS